MFEELFRRQFCEVSLVFKKNTFGMTQQQQQQKEVRMKEILIFSIRLICLFYVCTFCEAEIILLRFFLTLFNVFCVHNV